MTTATRWSIHFLGSVALLVLGVATVSQAQMGPLQDLASFPSTQLEIRSSAKAHRFDVWIADTPERQSQGLMFVRDLPPDRGMLFIHPDPHVISMWMKNTYIPLDMVFIAADGHIAKIVEQTKPHSLATISSGVSVAAVLELEGGEAAKRKLRIGDKVTWKSAVAASDHS